MLPDHEAIVVEEPAPNTEFTFSDDEPDDDATRAVQCGSASEPRGRRRLIRMMASQARL